MCSGGESGIRTHGTVARTPVFETGAFVHSAISPRVEPGMCWKSLDLVRPTCRPMPESLRGNCR